MEELIVAAYGMGTNSTAYLIEMVRRQEPMHLILSADTGGEFAHTYSYSDMFSEWLVAHGYPPVTRVVKGGRQETLEQYCLRTGMLPSLSYGFKSCSQKFKIEPQEKYVNNWEPARQLWKAGGKVTKLIGYDMDEPHRAAIPEDAKYRYRYPLLEWGWGRDECVEAIQAAGLPLPGKSSCFFCPSTRKAEIVDMLDHQPIYLARALAIEKNAEASGKNHSVNGLGRRLNWSNYVAEVTAARAANCPISTRGTDDPVPCGCYDGGSDE